MGGKGSGANPAPGALERAQVMAVLYREGYTLDQIGQQYGITRERVRQILRKRTTVTRDAGGHAIKARRKEEARAARRNARFLKSHGCTYDQYREVLLLGKKLMASGLGRERTPLGAFSKQRCSARGRGIGWELTFWQWWTIWQQSGHWEQRGRGQGYVMCRVGDEGPYAAGNVFIATSIENVSTAKHKKSGLPTGVKQNKSGTYTACRKIGTKLSRLGTFPTPELAHAAYLMAAPQFGVAA